MHDGKKLTFSALALSLAMSAGICNAALFVYDFEAPGFTVGDTTPLLDMPPDGGASGFTTSFTNTVDPDAFEITDFAINGLMVGQSLLQVAPFTSALTLAFSAPIFQLTVDFGLNATDGLLQLVTSSGTVSREGTNVGGGAGFPGGTLTFRSTVPFMMATLQGFDAGGATATQFAIDNLRIDTQAVPEPASLALLGFGLAVVALSRRRATHTLRMSA